uniref:Lysophospholipid acyltransferase 5 n=1 Tax=Ornithorhynchus anatinus TaxID=9258 RepID=F6VQS7_ORNAN
MGVRGPAPPSNGAAAGPGGPPMGAPLPAARREPMGARGEGRGRGEGSGARARAAFGARAPCGGRGRGEGGGGAPGGGVAAAMTVGERGFGLGPLAAALGASEQALRLILSIFLGYPLALYHRHFLFYKDCYLTHLFHVFSGISIAYFNFGTQLYHSLLCIGLQFLILRLMGRTVTAVLTTFCFQMAYLLAGYYYTATDQYDIKWTMPHCVLTLKLIGLAIDYYDGGKDQVGPGEGTARPRGGRAGGEGAGWGRAAGEEVRAGLADRARAPRPVPPAQRALSAEQRDQALRGVPSLLEVAGFSYFYGAFLVGPQFSMNNYMKLVRGEMTDDPGKKPNSVGPALRRLGLGLFYLVGYTLFSPYITDDYLLTADYASRPFWFRCVYMMVWGKFVLYKYVTCWLVSEGVCILSGLGYNGRDAQGRPRWDACANMKVWLFETTPLFNGTIASFNINTNSWVAWYIFKRLKFLGNKLLSQGITLLFLALWHGLHSGYLVCFQLEFLIIIVERQATQLIRESPFLSALADVTLLKPFFYLAQQTVHWVFMGYSMTAFCLFTWDKWFQVYKSVYFMGHVFFFSLLFLLPRVHKVMVPRKEKLKKAE